MFIGILTATTKLTLVGFRQIAVHFKETILSVDDGYSENMFYPFKDQADFELARSSLVSNAARAASTTFSPKLS